MLKKAIPQISKQMLINQLRELEEDGLIEREVFAEVPPRVEYHVTDYGKTLLSIIIEIEKWGLEDLGKNH